MSDKVEKDQVWESLRNKKDITVIEVKDFASTPCAFVQMGKRRAWLTCSKDGTKIHGYRKK